MTRERSGAESFQVRQETEKHDNIGGTSNTNSEKKQTIRSSRIRMQKCTGERAWTTATKHVSFEAQFDNILISAEDEPENTSTSKVWMHANENALFHPNATTKDIEIMANLKKKQNRQNFASKKQPPAQETLSAY